MPGTLHIVSRVAASLLGGYAFTWAFSALATTLLVACGMVYLQAWTLVTLVAFLLFLAVLLWSFAARSLLRVWAVLAGGAALMAFAALMLSRQLLA